jgi:hypothetical protein
MTVSLPPAAGTRAPATRTGGRARPLGCSRVGRPGVLPPEASRKAWRDRDRSIFESGYWSPFGGSERHDLAVLRIDHARGERPLRRLTPRRGRITPETGTAATTAKPSLRSLGDGVLTTSASTARSPRTGGPAGWSPATLSRGARPPASSSSRGFFGTCRRAGPRRRDRGRRRRPPSGGVHGAASAGTRVDPAGRRPRSRRRAPRRRPDRRRAPVRRDAPPVSA